MGLSVKICMWIPQWGQRRHLSFVILSSCYTPRMICASSNPTRVVIESSCYTAELSLSLINLIFLRWVHFVYNSAGIRWLWWCWCLHLYQVWPSYHFCQRILHIALKETNESKNVPGIAVVGEEECASHGCCKDDCHQAGSKSSFPSKSSSVTRRLCLITLSVLLTHLLCIFTSLSLSSFFCSPFFKITSE